MIVTVLRVDHLDEYTMLCNIMYYEKTEKNDSEPSSVLLYIIFLFYFGIPKKTKIYFVKNGVVVMFAKFFLAH